MGLQLKCPACNRQIRLRTIKHPKSVMHVDGRELVFTVRRDQAKCVSCGLCAEIMRSGSRKGRIKRMVKALVVVRSVRARQTARKLMGLT